MLTDAEIKKRIAEFPRWHYEFDLRGQRTPIFDRSIIQRHAQRKKYFFDPLVKFCGDSLQGKRVLDLGCNAGFWSLHAAQAGCDFVMGVDGREMHVRQAEFVFEVNGIDRSRYRFVQKDIFDLKPEELGTFDIVLCLGLLYHISKPMELMESIDQVNSDLLLIDTTVSRAHDSSFAVAHESLEEPRNAFDYELVLIPTKLAVVEMVRQFGYAASVLKPTFLSDADPEGQKNYRLGARRAFICAKRSDLSSFPAPAEAAAPASDGFGSRARRALKRLLKKG